MTILNVDAKALDWLTALYLSQDTVGCDEWRSGVDQHTLNQDAFKLPSRLIAKKFLFRCIFLGSAYAYANDPEFNHVSTATNYWQGAIDRFFDKYNGFGKWVERTTQETIRNGGIYTGITGRVWKHEPKLRGGEMQWPVTEIANFPIQSLEAEIMKLYRIEVFKRLKKEFPEAKLFSSVHDSLCIDTPEYLLYNIKYILEEEATKIPFYLEKYYGINFNLPFRVECSYGNSYGNVIEF